MDEAADKKLREAFKNSVINPFQNVVNKDMNLGLVRMIVWIFGRYVCTRRRKEIAKVDWREIYFNTYESGPDKGINYFEFIPDEDKSTRRTMQNPVIDPEKRKKKIRETPQDIHHPGHDPLDHNLFLYFRQMCPTKQVRLFVPTKPRIKSKHENPTPPSPTSATIQIYAWAKIPSEA